MTDIAKALSSDLAEIVERGGGSVVRVDSSRAPGSGTDVPVRLLRAGEPREVSVTVGTRGQ